ncbi:hypothetical protein CASFOL_007945 [Castilleja foliolosa]|uniref:Uncharacterized protein ycf68 n=1 Tax=Castilleja foliolosa TaxID=1961234 RepID=A0ABD3E617_9LAMI
MNGAKRSAEAVGCKNTSVGERSALEGSLRASGGGRSGSENVVRFTRGIRAVRGGPPRLLSSRESIHPLSVYGQLSLEHRFRPFISI